MEAGSGNPVLFQRFLHHPARSESRLPHDQRRMCCRAFHDDELHGLILDGLFNFFRIAAFQQYAYSRIMAVDRASSGAERIGSWWNWLPGSTHRKRGCSGQRIFSSASVSYSLKIRREWDAILRQGNSAVLPFEQMARPAGIPVPDMPGDGRLSDEEFFPAARVKFRRLATGSNTFSRESVSMEGNAFKHASGFSASSFPS